MNKFTKFLAFSALAALGASSANAETAIIDYTYGGDAAVLWGTKKAEIYDIAIRIADPGLVGCKVVGMKVPMRTSDNIINMTAWMSKELALATIDGKRVNSPDITSMDVTVNDNMITATFPEPYTITSDGVYVGYSFEVTALDNSANPDYNSYPVMVSEGAKDNGLFLHTSRTYRQWKDYSSNLGATSLISVQIEGDFQPNAMSIMSVPEANIAIEEEAYVSIPVINHGSQPVNTVDYLYEVIRTDGSDEVLVSGSSTAYPNLPAEFNAEGYMLVKIDPVPETGVYTLKVTALTLNGSAHNEDAGRTAEGRLNVLSVLPVKRAVVEEWTGTWCGWCTRGWVAMEELNKRYPDIVTVCYHQGDPMQLPGNSFPNMVSGYPGGWIDRKTSVDPYFGTSSSAPFHIEVDYLNANKQFTPVAIDMKTEWLDEEQTKIKATATLIWTKEQLRSCSLNFVLTQDELYDPSNDKFSQANYYSGMTSALSDPLLAPLVDMPSYVDGIHFNDVAVQVSGMLPIKDIVVDQALEMEYTFDISSNAILRDKSKLRMVVEVIENVGSYGNILNGLKEKQIGDTTLAVKNLTAADAQVVATEYFDLSGRVVRTPEQGLYIKVDRMSDGTMRSAKHMIR